MTIILKPFSLLLSWLSTGCNSYALALILFTIILKVILFPFNLKSKRSMIKTSSLQAEVQRIQKQYAKNPQKANEEITALYQRENASPMGGCIWTLIPLIILIAIYSVIREPLTYMMSLSSAQVDSVRTVLEGMGYSFVSDGSRAGAYIQLHMAEALSHVLPQVKAALPDIADKLFTINFNFLGLNIAEIPNYKFWAGGSFTWGYIGLFLIPIISAVMGFISSKYSMKISYMQNPDMANNSSNNIMLIISPIISLFIGYSMPAALGVYWVANSVFTMVSEWIFSIVLKKEYAQAAIDRAEREKRQKEEDARRKEEERAERSRRIEEEKKARKDMAKRKAMKQQQKKEKGVNNDASRVGIRAYARGRAYDPYRFSPDGPTAYRDPSMIVDEEAIEKAVEEKEIQAEVDAAMKKHEQDAVTEAASAAEETAAPAEEAAPAENAGEEGSAEFPKTIFDEQKNENE